MKAKDVAVIGIYTALLIGAQFIFSWAAGVEIVTALLAGFCYYFGLRNSVFLVNAFSFLRCFIFGFFPTVLILYLIYYNLFAVVFSALGKKFRKNISLNRLIFIVGIAAVCTIVFSLLDDIITPVFYGYSEKAAKAYFIASLAPMATQIICTIVSVFLIFPVLLSVFNRIFLEKGEKKLDTL